MSRYNDLFPLLVDSMFDDFLRTIPNISVHQTGFPVYDIYNDEDGNAILEFALAGYKAEDLKVCVEGSKLSISSEGVANSNNKNIHKRIAKRKFLTTFTDINNDFDLQSLKVSFEDGVLLIKASRKETSKVKVFELTNSSKSLNQ